MVYTILHTTIEGVVIRLIGTWVALGVWAGSAAAQDRFVPPPEQNEYTLQKNVMVPMRDGVNLAADVYLPKTAAGRFPVILLRSPYNKDTYGGSTRPNLKSTAYRFAAGHRIRLHVANSNFPQYERNSSTGGNIFDEATYLRSSNAAHFGPRYPPALVLPVVPK